MHYISKAASGKYSSSVSSLLRGNSTKHVLGKKQTVLYLTLVLQRINHIVVKVKFFFYPWREESLLIYEKVREDHIYGKNKTKHKLLIKHLYFPFIVHWNALHNTAVCLP